MGGVIFCEVEGYVDGYESCVKDIVSPREYVDMLVVANRMVDA